MKYKTIAVLTVILLASLTVSIGVSAQSTSPLDNITETPDQIILDTEDREGTVRLINNKFTQKQFNPGSTNKYRFTLDNQSEQEITTQFTTNINTTGTSIPTRITTPSNGVFSEQTLQPNEQKTFIVEFKVDQADIDTSEQVVFTLRETNTNTQKIYNLAVTPNSSSSNTQTIRPTGERQQLSSVVDRFKDNTETERSNRANGIPPVTPDGSDNAIGQVYNFERLLDSDTDNSTKVYPETDQLSVGFEFDNLPSNNYYTVQLRHRITHTSGIPSFAEVRFVSANGNEIDEDTTYYAGSTESNSSSFTTQYIQLSGEESDYIRDNGRLYVVVHHPEVKYETDGSYIERDNRDPIDLQESTTGTQYDNTQIDLQTLELLSSENPLTYTNSQVNVTDVRLKDNTGSIVSSPGQFDKAEQLRVEFTVENTGSSVITDQQVYLLENQQNIRNKSITLNPGETGAVTFYLNKFIEGEYTYTTPELDESVTALIETETASTPISPEITPLSGIEEVDSNYIVESLNTGIEVTASDSTAPNPIQSYQWTLEGEDTVESQSGETFNYSFSEKGQYNLELAVETTETTAYTNITLNVATTPPNAVVGDDTVVAPGENILFSGTQSSHPVEDVSIQEYTWDFDNGDSQNGSSLEYSFSNEGSYDVTLTVVDENGNKDTATRSVTVEGQKPVAEFTYSPETPVAELDEVVFDASDSFDPTGQGITQYQWNFGDGESDSTSVPSVAHTYSEPGEYEVRLTVSNVTRTETVTKTVEINGKPFDATITGDEEVNWGTLSSYNMYNTPDEKDLIETVEWTLYEGTGNDKTQLEMFEKREFDYEFENLGDYTLELYVEGGRFEDTESKEIEVITGPPRAETVESEDEIFISQYINFQGRDSYHPLDQVTIENYKWSYLEDDGSSQVISDGNGFENANVINYRFDAPTQNYTAENPQTPDPVELRDPYSVELEVTDTEGGTDTESVEVEVVNRGPIIDLPFDTIELWYSEPLELGGDFIEHPDSPPVEIENVEWEIRNPEGNLVHSERGRNINYLWNNGLGTYTVDVSVEDEFGATAEDSFEVDVDARDPDADFSIDIPDGDSKVGADDNVGFIDESVHNEPRGRMVDWDWSWDDGTDNSTVQNPTHNFDVNSRLDDGELDGGAETFDVTMTVTDQFGQQDSVTKEVTIDVFQSCLDVQENKDNPDSGVYEIYTPDLGETVNVFCDMEYDGGGWTLVLAANGPDDGSCGGCSMGPSDNSWNTREQYSTPGADFGTLNQNNEGEGWKLSDEMINYIQFEGVKAIRLTTLGVEKDWTGSSGLNNNYRRFMEANTYIHDKYVANRSDNVYTSYQSTDFNNQIRSNNVSGTGNKLKGAIDHHYPSVGEGFVTNHCHGACWVESNVGVWVK